MLFLSGLFFLILINLIGFYLENGHVLRTIFPLFIPVFFSYFFFKFKKLSILFITFLIFSLFADISAFVNWSFLKGNTTNIFSILSYISLILFILPKFKLVKTQNLVNTYFVFVLTIAIYFVCTVHLKLHEFIEDNINITFITLKIVTLVVLSFIALNVYFNEDSKPNVLFLTSVICLVFSAFLNFVNGYYLYNLSFVILEGIFYLLGIYLLFKSVVSDKQIESYGLYKKNVSKNIYI